MAEEKGLLEVEEAFFQENDMQFRGQYPNRFLLIHGDALLGDFATKEEALVEGVRQVGTGPFMIRRPGDAPPVLTAPALVLGLLNSVNA